MLFIPAVLDKLVIKLDKRANDHTIAAKCGFKKKERVKKSPSKFPVPDNAPKWTHTLTQAGTKRQIINEPSDGGEATAVPVTPKRTSGSKAKRRQIIDVTDDKADKAARRSSGNKQMVDEDDERNQTRQTCQVRTRTDLFYLLIIVC